MTATERLRALLDEREVEWACVDTRNGEEQDNLTEWNVPNAGWVTAWEFGGHISYTWHMGEKPTPQQAIAATLGVGTCHLVKERVGKSGKAYRMVCSECHHVIYDGWQEKPRYCAFCGARLEDE